MIYQLEEKHVRLLRDILGQVRSESPVVHVLIAECLVSLSQPVLLPAQEEGGEVK